MPTANDALHYRQFGLAVFPCGTRSKEPLRGTRGFLDAVRSIPDIEAAFLPDADFNIATAPGTGGYVVLDIDTTEAEDDAARLGVMREPVPVTRTAHGYHYWFRRPWPDPIGNVWVTPRLLARCDNGYVLLPPSVHPDGPVYTWLEPLVPSAGLIHPPRDVTLTLRSTRTTPGTTAAGTRLELPPTLRRRPTGADRLASLLHFGQKMKHTRHVPADVLLDQLYRINAECCDPPLTEGDVLLAFDRLQPIATDRIPEAAPGRNVTLTRLAGIIRRFSGITDTALVVQAVNATLCDPPLDDRELARTILASASRWLREWPTADADEVEARMLRMVLDRSSGPTTAPGTIPAPAPPVSGTVLSGPAVVASVAVEPGPVLATATVPEPPPNPAPEPPSRPAAPLRLVGEGETTVGPDEAVARLNRDGWAVVMEGNETRIWRPYQTPEGWTRYNKLSQKSFDLALAGRTVPVPTGNGVKEVPLAKYWLQSAEHTMYDRVVCDPALNGAQPGTLNLWTGFTVEPAPGDWSLMRDHIREVLCNNDPAHFDWLLKWIAWKLQHPGERSEVVTVLRGGEGTGKGTLGNTLLKLFGQHGFHLTASRQLTGDFNSWTRDGLFVFADEALYPGDRAAANVFKAYVTEPSVYVNEKNIAEVQMPNRLTFLMASNSDHVIAAATDARRFTVFDVSNAHANDRAYFTAIHQQLRAGGLSGLLFDMLAMDLSQYDHRIPLITAALGAQVRQTFNAVESYLVELVENGRPLIALTDDPPIFDPWIVRAIDVPVRRLHDDYIEFARRLNLREYTGHQACNAFNRKLAQMLTGQPLQRVRPSTRALQTSRANDLIRLPPLANCIQNLTGGREGIVDRAVEASTGNREPDDLGF